MEQVRFRMDSPVGPLTLVSDGAALTHIYFETQKHGSPPNLPERRDAVIEAAIKQLSAYFQGRRKHFDLALNPRGTPFQMRVWAGLLKIPFGQTLSYGALAAAIGSPKAVRAVGLANGRNPLPIVIPCHRVIGANGGLTGFGGGVERKQKLLELEGGAARALLL